jgi:hypothetical protein
MERRGESNSEPTRSARSLYTKRNVSKCRRADSDRTGGRGEPFTAAGVEKFLVRFLAGRMLDPEDIEYQ